MYVYIRLNYVIVHCKNIKCTIKVQLFTKHITYTLMYIADSK